MLESRGAIPSPTTRAGRLDHARQGLAPRRTAGSARRPTPGRCGTSRASGLRVRLAERIRARVIAMQRQVAAAGVTVHIQGLQRAPQDRAGLVGRCRVIRRAGQVGIEPDRHIGHHALGPARRRGFRQVQDDAAILRFQQAALNALLARKNTAAVFHGLAPRRRSAAARPPRGRVGHRRAGALDQRQVAGVPGFREQRARQSPSHRGRRLVLDAPRRNGGRPCAPGTPVRRRGCWPKVGAQCGWTCVCSADAHGGACFD